VAAVAALASLSGWRSLRAASLTWFAAVVVLVSAIKLGSGPNYWLPTFFASSVLLGPALHRLRLVGGTAATAAAAAAVAFMLMPGTIERLVDVGRVPGQLSALRDANAEAVERIESLNGELLADRHDLAIESGHRPTFDAPPFAILAVRGNWDPDPLANAVRRRRFGVIQSSFALHSDPIPTYQGIRHWPRVVVEAARKSYCLRWSTDVGSLTAPGIWIYAPCRRPGTPRG
jgi:hypothetical protein